MPKRWGSKPTRIGRTQGQDTKLPQIRIQEAEEVFGSERLTGTLLDRLTHHVHTLEMNGESYRLKRSREAAARRTGRHFSLHLHCPLSLPNGRHSTAIRPSAITTGTMRKD